METNTNLVTAPAIEPLTLQDAKDHLRVDNVTDDSVIEPLIEAARIHAEKDTGRAFITQTWDLFLNGFPSGGRVIEIPKPPLVSVTSVKYLDQEGAQQTLSTAIYTVDSTALVGRVYLSYNQVWPTIRSQRKAVEIRFVAGYGTNAQDVPQGIRHGLRMLITHLYDNRGTTGMGVTLQENPMAYRSLVSPYKVFSV